MLTTINAVGVLVKEKNDKRLSFKEKVVTRSQFLPLKVNKTKGTKTRHCITWDESEGHPPANTTSMR